MYTLQLKSNKYDELEYCNKWNILYIINYFWFMFDTIFHFDNVWGIQKYLIKSEKAWLHINFFSFAQNTDLNKFWNSKQILITHSVF